MAWNTSSGGTKIKLKNPNKSSRFYYDSGDENPLLFKGLSIQVKPTLRSLYLENCYFDASVLLNSLDGCVNLTTVKLYEVAINHDNVEVPLPNFQKVQLPKLVTFHVHDISNLNKSVFDWPFHKVKEEEKKCKQQELAQYNVEFYSQFLQAQLSNSGCKYLYFCKFHVVGVDLTIKLKGYTVIKYSPLKTFEKLIISPLLDASKNQFLKNEPDQNVIKNLACSDKVLTLATTPRSLDDLNLYITGEKTTLHVDLAISKKLFCLKSLTLSFQKRIILDLNILASGLNNLKELVIIKAVVDSTAVTPFQLDECSFDQCQFSERFIISVPSILDCKSIAVDVQRVPNWNGIFKTNLMSMNHVIRVVVWCVDTKEPQDRLTFGEMYSKRRNGNSFLWQTSLFEDAEIRRSIILNHRDFYEVKHNFPINLLESGDIPKPVSMNMLDIAKNSYSNSFFAIFLAVIVFMVYSYRS